MFIFVLILICRKRGVLIPLILCYSYRTYRLGDSPAANKPNIILTLNDNKIIILFIYKQNVIIYQNNIIHYYCDAVVYLRGGGYGGHRLYYNLHYIFLLIINNE